MNTMAKLTDTSSSFRIIGALAALLLVLAAALIYAGSGNGGTGGGELAALSQSVRVTAADALRSEPGAFDSLARDTARISELRAEAADAVPGTPESWQSLVGGATEILAKRRAIDAVNGAAAAAARSAETMLVRSNELLEFAGATTVIQDFQRRAADIPELVDNLTTAADAEFRAAVVAENVSYLQNIVDALAGEESPLDVRPLDEETQIAALQPLLGHVVELQSAAETLVRDASEITALGAALGRMETGADGIAKAYSGTGAADASPGFLLGTGLPIALIGVALLLIVGLFALNARSVEFERAATEQAEQNDRNQQAILRLLDEMGSLADGDLTVEATVTEDITGTIADSFNYAIEELRKLVATVNETAIMVDSAAKQTETTAAHMARAADNQGREISAATESIVSMAASIEEVSGNAERSSDVARHSVEVAHKGGEAVRRTIDGMNTIRETIQETSKRIKRLGESSQEIGNIIELINDIAEQTNILALNASIQASMAGEAGRGFAVVADEVQRLAERSTNATKQIEVLVRTIQSDTNEAVVSMERSTTDVVGGALLAENAGAALDEIEQVSNQIASLVQNISVSARQQAGSAADVTRRTTRLKEISEQTSQATSATADAISKLSELASQLRMTVAGFTLPSAAMQASPLRSATPSVVVSQPPPREEAAAAVEDNVVKPEAPAEQARAG